MIDRPAQCPKEAMMEMTEWNLATLEGAMMRKSTSKSDISRFITIAHRSVFYCTRFLSEDDLENTTKRCVRLRAWVEKGVPNDRDEFEVLVRQQYQRYT